MRRCFTFFLSVLLFWLTPGEVWGTLQIVSWPPSEPPRQTVDTIDEEALPATFVYPLSEEDMLARSKVTNNFGYNFRSFFLFGQNFRTSCRVQSMAQKPQDYFTLCIADGDGLFGLRLVDYIKQGIIIINDLSLENLQPTADKIERVRTRFLNCVESAHLPSYPKVTVEPDAPIEALIPLLRTLQLIFQKLEPAFSDLVQHSRIQLVPGDALKLLENAQFLDLLVPWKESGRRGKPSDAYGKIGHVWCANLFHFLEPLQIVYLLNTLRNVLSDKGQLHIFTTACFKRLTNHSLRQTIASLPHDTPNLAQYLISAQVKLYIKEKLAGSLLFPGYIRNAWLPGANDREAPDLPTILGPETFDHLAQQIGFKILGDASRAVSAPQDSHYYVISGLHWSFHRTNARLGIVLQKSLEGYPRIRLNTEINPLFLAQVADSECTMQELIQKNRESITRLMGRIARCISE